MSIIYGRYMRGITRQVQDSLAHATQLAEEKISNIRTVRAFAHERKECDAYNSKIDEVLKLSYKESLARGIFFGFLQKNQARAKIRLVLMKKLSGTQWGADHSVLKRLYMGRIHPRMRVIHVSLHVGALDAESEYLVQDALEKLMSGRTVLTIAHRLSTIKTADQIAVISGGQLTEIGSYRDLISVQDGIFRKLVERQTIVS
nr:hypothetical protein BaRGS_012309 [Batillaria attramentaria]